MSDLDNMITEHFQNFRDSEDELLVSVPILDYIKTSLTKREKQLFYLRVVKEMTFYDIAEHTGIPYRIAQMEYQAVAKKIYMHTVGRENTVFEFKPEDPEFYNYKDRLVLYQDDFLKAPYIDAESIDITITSPPYNVGIDYGVYEDTLDYNVYLQWSGAWMKKVHELTKPDGRLCVNVPIDCKYPGNERAVTRDIINAALESGWKFRDQITWNKNHVANRCMTGSVYSASSPVITHAEEAILVFYKTTWKKTSGSGVSTVSNAEWWKLTNSPWHFPGQSKKAVHHPAPFPITLPYNCLQLFSYVDDVVLDPFVGSGTTMVACSMLDRKCIGFDVNPEYLEVAKARTLTEGQLAQMQLFEASETRQQQVLFDGK